MLKILDEIGKIEIVLVHAINSDEAISNSALSLPKHGDIHSHLTYCDCRRDGSEHDPTIGRVECGTGKQAEQITPSTTAQYQTAILLINSMENIDIALQK